MEYNMGDYRHNFDLNSQIHSMINKIQSAEVKVFQLDRLLMQRLNKIGKASTYNSGNDEKFRSCGNKISCAPKDSPESRLTEKIDRGSGVSSSTNHHERRNCRRFHTVAMSMKQVEGDVSEGTRHRKSVDASSQTHTLYLEKRCPFCGRDVLDAIYRLATSDLKKMAKTRKQRLLDELAEKEGGESKQRTIFGRRLRGTKTKETSFESFSPCAYDALGSPRREAKSKISRARPKSDTPPLKVKQNTKSRKDNDVSKPILSKISKPIKKGDRRRESQLDVKVKEEAQKMMANMFEEFFKKFGIKKSNGRVKEQVKNVRKTTKKQKKPERSSSSETSATTNSTTEKETSEATTSSSNEESGTSGKEDSRRKLEISTGLIDAQTLLYYEDDGTRLSERESVE